MDIIEKVRQAGVVGAGGAGFPTHVKLSAKVDTYLVNAAECEPLLRTDQQLLVEQTDAFVEGAALASEAVGACDCIIAIKGKYEKAVAALKKRMSKKMKLAILPDVYPAGDEIITIRLATGRIVKPGSLPASRGVVVNNPQTVINVANACHDLPVTTRTITVTGFVCKPFTATVPLGTSYSALIEYAGGATVENAACIDGGPVMGAVLADLQKYVRKTSGGLVILPAEHPLIRFKNRDMRNTLVQARAICEQCMFCTELCPRKNIGHPLYPHLNVRALSYRGLADLKNLSGALLCSECGVCDYYACPVGISPRKVNVLLKNELRSSGIRPPVAIQAEDRLASAKLVPSKRMAQRLGLSDIYYQEAPMIPYSDENECVTVMLSQHIGVPARVLVQTGTAVKTNDLIAAIPEQGLGANIHSPVDGVVQNILSDAIVISRHGGIK